MLLFSFSAHITRDGPSPPPPLKRRKIDPNNPYIYGIYTLFTFVNQNFKDLYSKHFVNQQMEMDMEMQRADVFLSCSDVSLILSITFF